MGPLERRLSYIPPGPILLTMMNELIMRSLWQKINNSWYYLHPFKDGTGTLGACLIGPACTPDGYYVDETGAWVKIDAN